MALPLIDALLIALIAPPMPTCVPEPWIAVLVPPCPPAAPRLGLPSTVHAPYTRVTRSPPKRINNERVRIHSASRRAD